MAMVDALDFLSVNQTLDGTSYSAMCKDFGVPKDAFAGEQPMHVLVTCLGDFTLGTALTIQVLGYNDIEAMSDVFIISQSEVIKAAEIKLGRQFTLPLPSVNKKYKRLCLKYVVTGGTESSKTFNDDPCPPNPLLPSMAKDTKVDNTFNAVILRNSASTITYAYANEDKEYQ